MSEQNRAAGTSSSLMATDAAAEAVAVAPRVSLAELEASIAEIEASIAEVYYTTGARALREVLEPEHIKSLRALTICLVVMKNGYIVLGKSVPASPENFNVELGQKLAYEDTLRQVWPLMGFALRERLSAEPHSRL